MPWTWEEIWESREKEDQSEWYAESPSPNRRKYKLASRDGGWTCHYCGIELDKLSCHIDHKTPKYMGGSNKSENLVLSCPACNLKKHTTPYEEFKK